MFFCQVHAQKVIGSSDSESLLPLEGHTVIENRAVTARREALPNFYGKKATIIVANRKLQVLLICLSD